MIPEFPGAPKPPPKGVLIVGDVQYEKRIAEMKRAIEVIRDKIQWLNDVVITSGGFINLEAQQEFQRCARVLKEQLKIIMGDE